MGKTLVIGNGFDIAQGYNTSYQDFVAYTKDVDNIDNPDIKHICNNNSFIKYFQKMDGLQNWIDIEKEIGVICASFSKCLSLLEECSSITGNANRDNLTIRERTVVDAFDKFFSGKKNLLALNLRYYSVLQRDKLIQDLRTEHSDVIKVLSYYLGCEMKRLKKKDINKPRYVLDNIYDYIINFNYTHTYRNYGINDEDVFFIHGNVDSPESMVFGMPEGVCDDIEFVYFQKYFQRIQKKSGVIDKSIMSDGSEQEEGSVAHIFGMSLGKNDEDIIRIIFNSVNEVYIYCNGQNDYERKIVNLIDIYGRKEVEKNIYFNIWNFIDLIKETDC